MSAAVQSMQIELVELATGARLFRWSVDAREMVATGAYVLASEWVEPVVDAVEEAEVSTKKKGK